MNQFNTSAPISEIEIFKQVWPWIDGYSGMLMRKRGSVIDFPNSEVRKGSGSVLILTRNDEEIAVFQTWAGYHMIEGAP